MSDTVSALRFKPVMVIDGQWGSTGKGLIAGYLAMKKQPRAVVCNFGPNAGHTLQFKDRKPLITRMLPTSGVMGPSVREIFIGPGAVVDIDVLVKECVDNAELLKGKKIYIHERAVQVLQRHRDAEAEALVSIASTRKGTGAAIADKVMRSPDAIMRHVPGSPGERVYEAYNRAFHVVSDAHYLTLLRPHVYSGSLIIESSQGFELGVNTGSHYPHCTSRDITPVQILSDCGITWLVDCFIVASMRTFPIRVGNEIRAGKQVGYSGDVYPDQREVTFQSLNVEVEKTTVTQKPRRIFTWSGINMSRVIERIRPDAVFLNFVNYLDPAAIDLGFDSCVVKEFLKQVEGLASTYPKYSRGMPLVRWIGAGPCIEDIFEHERFSGCGPWFKGVDGIDPNPTCEEDHH